MEIRNTEQIMDLLNYIEKTFPVDTWIVNNYHLWPLLRIEIGSYLGQSYLHKDAENTYKTPTLLTASFKFIKKFFKGYKEIYYSQWKDRQATDKITPRDIMYMTDGCGYMKIADIYYERYYDALNTFFKVKRLSALRLDMNHMYVAPRLSPSIYVQTRLEFHIIKNVIYNIFLKPQVDFSHLPQFSEFLAFCAAENINSLSFNPSNLKKRLRKLDTIKSYFKPIIEKVQPKLMFITGFNNDYGLAVINLCREKNIKTFDVQHGFQDALHPSYGHWNRVPKGGYNVLPDYFWCWSDSEAQTINEWSHALNIHKPLAGGNLLLELLSDPSSVFVKNLDKKFADILDNSKTHKKDKINILFTLQWDTVDDHNMMSLYNAMKKSGDKYNWWIRLHPVMRHQREMIRQLFIKNNVGNFELDFSSDLPLYIVLKKTQLHITCSSAVIIEAAQLGIYSIMTNPYGEPLFEDYIDKGIVKKAYTGDDIIKAIQDLPQYPKIIIDTHNKVPFEEIKELLYLEQLVKN